MSRPRKYEHLFFDLDHTLWDFEVNSRATIKQLFLHHNLDNRMEVSAEEFYLKYIEINDSKWGLYRQGKLTKERLRAERFIEAFGNFGLHNNAFSSTFEKQYLAECPKQTELIPGAMEVVKALSAHYQMHIITNGFKETQEIKLRESGLGVYFDKLFTSDHLGVAKPDRAIFSTALKQSGAKRKDSLMIGDSLVADIIGAKNCGIDQVYFNPEGKKHQEKITYEIREMLQLVQVLDDT